MKVELKFLFVSFILLFIILASFPYLYWFKREEYILVEGYSSIQDPVHSENQGTEVYSLEITEQPKLLEENIVKEGIQLINIESYLTKEIYSTDHPEQSENIEEIQNVIEYTHQVEQAVDKHQLDVSINLMHISKTAVTSFYLEMIEKGVSFVNKSPGADEKCFTDLQLLGQDIPMASFIREPRSHVYSLYLECKYDYWGMSVTKNTNFPRDPLENVTEGNLPAFRDWLLSFKMSQDDFGCYHPINFQTRFFVCEGRNPHHKIGQPVKVDEMVEKRLRNIWFLGISEYYPVSVCIFKFQMGMNVGEECDCSKIASQTETHVRETHGVPPHSLSLVPLDLIEMIDAYTKEDRKLYNLALDEFMKRVAEVETKLNFPLICGENE